MLNHTHSPWPARMASLALWMLVGASAVFWALRLSGGSGGGVLPVLAPTSVMLDGPAMARALGVQPMVSGLPGSQAVAASSSLALIGILSGRDSGGGAALLGVGDAAARPFRVGSVVRDGLVLQSLSARTVRLGERMGGPTLLTLELSDKD